MITPRAPEWFGTREHLIKEIEAARDKLEQVKEPLLCAELRGQIAAMRAFIAHVERTEEQPAEEAPGYNM